MGDRRAHLTWDFLLSGIIVLYCLCPVINIVVSSVLSIFLVICIGKAIPVAVNHSWMEVKV